MKWYTNRRNKLNKDIIWTPALLLKKKKLLLEDKHCNRISRYVPGWIKA
tara:strand:- start:39 stop:185 length:147 start_codon:yes stop_codon:yes gene_type:complete